MRDELFFLASTNHATNRGHIDKHLQGYSTIQFVTAIHGALLVAYDEREYVLREGAWFFPAHPGPRIRFHGVCSTHYWHHRHVGFRGPLVENWKAAGLWLDGPQCAPSDIDWAARLDGIIALVRRTDRFAHLRASNLLEGILLELAEARDEGGRADAWLQGVLERLDGENAPDLGRLGADLGLSPTALRRKFKAATGLTMQDYCIQRRITAARALLMDTDLPLKTIAARLNYQNEFFFSRQFRAQTGVAPGAFRKSRGLG